MHALYTNETEVLNAQLTLFLRIKKNIHTHTVNYTPPFLVVLCLPNNRDRKLHSKLTVQMMDVVVEAVVARTLHCLPDYP